MEKVTRIEPKSPIRDTPPPSKAPRTRAERRAEAPRPTPPKIPEKPKPTRDFRPELAELFGTVALAGGMIPVEKVQAQAALVDMYAMNLATGLDAAAKASPYVRSGLVTILGDGSGDNTAALGVVVALAAISPFVFSSIELWRTPKKDTPEAAEHDKLVSSLASAQKDKTDAVMKAAMQQFIEAQQEAEQASGRANVPAQS
jgi:hypothetical protein